MTQQLSIQQAGLSPFLSMLHNSRRPDMMALEQDAKDGAITQDEFVKDMGSGGSEGTASTKFTAIFNNAKKFRNTGETGDITVISSNEVISLWEEIDKMSSPSWISVQEKESISVGGKIVGTIEVNRRTVPKGWKMTLPLDDSGAFRSVNYLEAKVHIDTNQLHVTARELANLIRSPGDYVYALTAVSGSSDVAGRPDFFWNTFSIAVGTSGYDVIHMAPPTPIGNSTLMSWTTRGPKGEDYNDLVSGDKASGYKVDTDGDWTIIDNGTTGIDIVYHAIVDVPGDSTIAKLAHFGVDNLEEGKGVTGFLNSKLEATTESGADYIIDKVTTQLIIDLIKLADALDRLGIDPNDIEKIKATLRNKSIYDKDK